MLVYRLQVSRWILGADEEVLGKVLIQASEAVDTLINLIRERDSEGMRVVVRYQVEQIVRISRGLAHPQELIPLDLLIPNAGRLSGV
jgi:hypothetical protein